MTLAAEVSLAGAILIDADCLSVVRDQVTAEMFSNESCRAVYEAACRLQDQGQVIDPVTVKKAAPGLENDFLLESMDSALTAANAEIYAQEVRTDWLRREAVGLLQSASRDLMAGQDPLDVTARLGGKLDDLAGGEGQRGVVTAGEAGMSLVRRWELADKGDSFTVPTGYATLDKILGGGMIRAGLYIMAARPGCGKTTLAQNIAQKMLDAGRRVLFFSLEMSVWELEARRLALRDGRHTAAELLRRDFPDGDYGELVPQLLELGKEDLIYCTKTRVRVSDVSFLARRAEADVVVIDYLGLLEYEAGRTVYERVTATSNALKRLARSLGIPVLCLAQLNRELEARNDPRPRLSDLRDSGAIEQDADAVLLLHRPPGESNESKLTPLEVTVAKNRHGPTGSVHLLWAMRNGRIVPEGGGR